MSSGFINEFYQISLKLSIFKKDQVRMLPDKDVREQKTSVLSVEDVAAWRNVTEP